ncbi:MAG: orotidine-5'-phosphate decarboxylase [Pyrinomonadaceae bacterium]|nr:orotidine-5'-phosphate decarboxylase [Pyrinomonadaceae bacterium]
MTDQEKIIVALDVETAKEAREIIAELRGEVGAFKIGLQLFTAAGASFVRETVEAGIRVFLDVKFHDIPNTTAKASIEVARLGVWMFNVHALGGAEMMRRTVETVGEICERENLQKPKIIGVTVLTSANQATLKEVGIEAETDAQVLKLAQLTAKCGLDGVVASPLETALIRKNVENKDFLVITPGIRSRKLETFDDQRRVTTASEAIAAGANYLVIGRPIGQAENRVSAARQILEEMANI